MITSSFCPNDCDKPNPKVNSTQQTNPVHTACLDREWWWTVSDEHWINAYLVGVNELMTIGNAYADTGFYKDKDDAIIYGNYRKLEITAKVILVKVLLPTSEDVKVNDPAANLLFFDGSKILHREILP